MIDHGLDLAVIIGNTAVVSTVLTDRHGGAGRITDFTRQPGRASLSHPAKRKAPRKSGRSQNSTSQCLRQQPWST
jgi:hypothetical protein